MKSSSLKFLFISGAALLGLAASASAQNAVIPAPSTTLSSRVGLLGATYVGAEFGYTHQVDGGPRVVRNYGFVTTSRCPKASISTSTTTTRPPAKPESARNSRSSRSVAPATVHSAGARRSCRQHGLGLEKAGRVRDNGFDYSLKTGIEFQLGAQLVLTPYVSYEAAPSLHFHEWNYGVLTNYRVERRVERLARREAG